MIRDKAKQLSLMIIVADFPLLYIGAVTLEDPAISVAALIIMGISAIIATLVY